MGRVSRSVHLSLIVWLSICLSGLLAVPVAAAPAADPLPSWNEGAAKQAVIDFVRRVTTPGSREFVPVPDRIATFDNDGTLWPEIPLIQGVFVLTRLKSMAARDPELASREPFKAALEGDRQYFAHDGERKAMQILSATSANLTQEQFDAEASQFFATARHPTLNAPFTALAYRPMVEVLELLRANGFQTYLCSGGGADFMRVVSQRMYGIPPEQVIGSSLAKAAVERDGELVLWRKPAVAIINDKGTKPVNIDLHIGKRPIFAAGNVRSGGDIAMLEYSQGSPGASLQLMVNHDDGDREFSYREKDNESLRNAREHRWTIVSMKQDWKVIFGQQ